MKGGIESGVGGGQILMVSVAFGISDRVAFWCEEGSEDMEYELWDCVKEFAAGIYLLFLASVDDVVYELLCRAFSIPNRGDEMEKIRSVVHIQS